MTAIILSTITFIIHIIIFNQYASGHLELTNGITIADENMTLTMLFCITVIAISLYENKDKS